MLTNNKNLIQLVQDQQRAQYLNKSIDRKTNQLNYYRTLKFDLESQYWKQTNEKLFLIERDFFLMLFQLINCNKPEQYLSIQILNLQNGQIFKLNIKIGKQPFINRNLMQFQTSNELFQYLRQNSETIKCLQSGKITFSLQIGKIQRVKQINTTKHQLSAEALLIMIIWLKKNYLPKDTINEVKTQNNALNQQVQVLTKRKEILKKKILMIQKQNDTIKKQIIQSDNHIKQLKLQNINRFEQVQALKKREEILNKKIQMLQKQNDTIKKQIVQCKNHINKLQPKIINQFGQVQALTKKEEILNKKIQMLQKQNDTIKKQIVQCKNLIKKLQSKNINQFGQVQALTKKEETLNKKIQMLQKQNDTIKKQIVQCKNHINKLQPKIINQFGQVQALTKKEETLNKKIQMLQKQNDTFKKQIVQCKNHINKLQPININKPGFIYNEEYVRSGLTKLRGYKGYYLRHFQGLQPDTTNNHYDQMITWKWYEMTDGLYVLQSYSGKILCGTFLGSVDTRQHIKTWQKWKRIKCGNQAIWQSYHKTHLHVDYWGKLTLDTKNHEEKAYWIDIIDG